MITIERAISIIDKALGSTNWTTIETYDKKISRNMIYERNRGYDSIRVAGFKNGVVVASLRLKTLHKYLQSDRDVIDWAKKYLEKELK